jgi:transcriptional regulator with XRE-family HTH domain
MRKESLIPRAVLARKIGVISESLANYESGRSPLPFGVGLSICRSLDINPQWLATGAPPKIGFVEPAGGIGLPPDLFDTIRFSEGIDKDKAMVETAIMLDKVRTGADLPTEERVVGRRLVFYRGLFEITRSRFAVIAGIKPEALKRYESGSDPVPFVVGERICAVLDLSQLWLALGEKPLGGHIPLDERTVGSDTRATFYQVINMSSAALQAKKPAKPSGVDGFGRLDGTESRDSLVNALAKWHRDFAENIPANLYQEYFREVTELAPAFLKRHRTALNAWAMFFFDGLPHPDRLPPTPARGVQKTKSG